MRGDDNAYFAAEIIVSELAAEPQRSVRVGGTGSSRRLAIAAMLVAALSAARLLATTDTAVWRADGSTAAVILQGVAGFCLAKATRGGQPSGLAVIATAGISTAVGLLTFIASLIGPPRTAAVGFFGGAAGWLLLQLNNVRWTRPLALAMLLTLSVVLCVMPRLRELPVTAAVQTSVRWASLSLDVTGTPHLAAPESLAAMHGELTPYAAAASWHGIWPMIAIACGIAVATSRSLLQTLAMSTAATLTWIVVQAVSLWLAATWTDPLTTAASSSLGTSVWIRAIEIAATYLACPVSALAAAALTDPIPLGRGHADAPVASFLYNTLVGLPGSLISPPARSIEGQR